MKTFAGILAIILLAGCAGTRMSGASGTSGSSGYGAYWTTDQFQSQFKINHPTDPNDPYFGG